MARRAVWAAASPTARVASVGQVATTVALASAPVAVVVGRGGTDLESSIVLLAIGAGASVAWAVDDPAADVLAPMPVGATTRLALRLVAAAIVALSLTGAALLLSAAGPGLPPSVTLRFPEAAAAAAVAVGLAVFAARRGGARSGISGVIGGLLVPVTVAGLSVRWPRHLPTFADSHTHVRWWLLTGIGALVALRSGRDTASR